jgi:hypothetical protein
MKMCNAVEAWARKLVEKWLDDTTIIKIIFTADTLILWYTDWRFAW